ncbi:LysR family transcriptional regulator [Shimia sp. R10_1]|uniref:LysR substrate-binding domain-containing protein n=1 Tax=Shimia sp. R10_1 TaxID=2821095 RepID=UPI001AD9EC64|nr:LysR family transcriptional regulator [Shimia sp. R10_1]
MKLNHRQLEAFRAMMETSSVTEAARRIHITQPAASRLLSDLEHQIGYPLFIRQKKRLTPTSEAVALFEEVDRSFIGLATIAEAAREIGTFRRGALHIAGLPALALEFLPDVISEFCVDRPDISVALQIHSSQKVLQCIASQQFELGFAERSVSHPAVASETLCEVPMVAVLPIGHRLTEREALTPRDMEGESFISLGLNYAIRQQIDAIFKAANVERRLQAETQLSFAAGHLVASGSGISIIDPITAHYLTRLNLVVSRPFEPSVSYAYQMLFPRHRPQSQICEAFAKITKERLYQRLMETTR